jgi:hypothetical protein
MSAFWLGFLTGIPVGAVVLIFLVIGLLALQPRWFR